MIQRIQSIYLLIALIVCAAMAYVPLGAMVTDTVQIYYYYGFVSFGSGLEKNVIYSWPALISMLLAIGLISLAIFSFKNRKRQSLYVQLSFIVQILVVVTSLMVEEITSMDFAAENTQQSLQMGYGIMIMVIPMILSLLALRAIRKDEALVRSADRMR